MSVLKFLVDHHTNKVRFTDYRSFSNYILGRRTRLPGPLVKALTMNHGRIWKSYYSQIKGAAGGHELLLLGERRGDGGEVYDFDAIVLRRTSPEGKQLLSLLYGHQWVIGKTAKVNKIRFQLWRKGRADEKEGEAFKEKYGAEEEDFSSYEEEEPPGAG